ncbi:hypothetical protein Avbf_08479 [Armadillidium vulgare]|nr:hypothetical protein Avbf_08479 [Armadillidium vulgare]
MNEMAMKCILILRKSINTETLDEIYTVSLKYKDNLLKRKCIEEIQRSGRKLLEMASKGSLSPDLFLSVLGSESLEVPEIDIFKAVMSWAKIKIKNFENLDFKKFLKPYLYEIDFLSMQQEEILGPVSEEEIFTKEEIFAILLGSKNVTDELATDGESSCKNLHSYFGVPASYPMYLRIQRRERRFFHSQLHGISIQIFMYLKCDHKGKWLPCGHFPILTLQVSAEIYITRIRARPECFVGENFLEVMDQDIVLGTSNVNGPPWDFNPPVEIVRNHSYVINLNGKGKICHHEFQMYSKTHGNIEICGNSILCDVTVRYIK